MKDFSYLNESLLVAATGIFLLFFYRLLHKVSPERALRISLGLGAWMVFIGACGYFRALDYKEGVPYLILVAIIVPLATVIAAPIIEGWRFLRSLPLLQAHYLQSIRIITLIFTSVVMWQGKSTLNQLPFNGNPEVFFAITAPLIAFFGFKKNIFSRTVLLLWEFGAFFSLILQYFLIIEVIPGLVHPLSDDVVLSIYTQFPYVWIFAFIYPALLGLHLLSIQKILTKKKRVRSGSSSRNADQKVSKSSEKILSRHKEHL
jgi:hypothetical protein